MNIRELEEKILKARNDYYNDQPTISDLNYDTLIEELRLLDPNNKAITNIGSPVVSEWKKVKHNIPMGSLDKVNQPNELKDWSIGKGSQWFTTQKLDGISIEVIYEGGTLVQASTRGNGFIGEDITVNVVKMGGVVGRIDGFTGSLRGEIILTKTNHQKYFANNANPRNAASGTSKRLDGVGCEHLNIMFYQAIGNVDFSTEIEQFKWLESNGLKTPEYWLFDNIDSVSAHWRSYQDNDRDKLDYDIDGLVVRVNDLVEQMSFGEKDMKPAAVRAFKFDNIAKESTITSITWQVGNSGRLTPVAEIEPIILVGAEVRRASIYNVSYIQKLQLDVGAKVLVCRANDVIPRVEELVSGVGTIAKTPDKCPSCNGALEMQGENLQCLNTDSCPAQVVGRIVNWVAELNLLELGDTLIERLVSSGLVKDVSDLYSIKVDDLCKLERMAKKSANNVHKSIWSNTSLPIEQLIGSLSIPMVATSTVKLIVDAGYNTLDKMFALDISSVERIKGLGPVKAKSFVDGVNRNKDIINRLINNGIRIKEKIVGSLSGTKIAITGSTNMKRADLEKFITDNGGEYKSSISKTCTHLVIADINSSSSKAVSAKKLGIKLISEESLLKFEA